MLLSFLSVMPFLFVNIIWNYPVKQFCSSKRKLTINSTSPHVTNNKYKKSKPNWSKGFTTYSVNYPFLKMLHHEIIINIIYWIKIYMATLISTNMKSWSFIHNLALGCFSDCYCQHYQAPISVKSCSPQIPNTQLEDGKHKGRKENLKQEFYCRHSTEVRSNVFTETRQCCVFFIDVICFMKDSFLSKLHKPYFNYIT